MIMSLLLMIALAMLSFSTVVTTTAASTNSQLRAQANARVALMIALGELQAEMGPDMRISAESALFDTDKETEKIDGIQQSHWTASYNAWGTWLNAEYSLPQASGATSLMKISDTYRDKREPMFRRWLLSLPEDQVSNIEAPVTGAGLDEKNSVILVGKGSLGSINSESEHLITRAFLQQVDQGNIAWWVGPENHKAIINKPSKTTALNVTDTESSQGNTSEVGISSIEGFGNLKDDTEKSNKLISELSLRPAAITREHVGKHFYDLTAHSKGLQTSVRTGALKKDLSLLLDADTMPTAYKFKSGGTQEPSIRPMSADLRAKNPQIPERHFASWTRMRHYYRTYRQTSDSNRLGTGEAANLKWDNNDKPWTPIVTPLASNLNTSNTYIRVPILAKLTFIYSLQSIAVPNTNPRRYNCYLVYTPVYTFWNPYNVEMRVGSRLLGTLSMPYKILPLGFYSYMNGAQQGGVRSVYQGLKQDHGSSFGTQDNSEIVFQPGELKLFSYRSSGNSTGKQTAFLPGFDPQAIGGDKLLIHKKVLRTQRPGMALTFANPSGQGGNVWFGNTPGSLNNPLTWLPDGYNWLPTMYAHDWFQKDQVNTRITPAGFADVAKWQFSDDEPLPFAFNQFVIKTSSEFEYESIGWNKDWRSKNWLQAPPYYFGSAQYISENQKIAHTQRLDNPYVMHFGPMSASEMPKVVPHIGERASLGSGSSPYEKVNSAVLLELPTAPLSSIAAFSNMRMNPGWTVPSAFRQGPSGEWKSYSGAAYKATNYQSGITGGGLGNSFIHPVLPRNDIYRYFDNSKSQDVSSWANNTTERDNKVYNDYWDHCFLLNDALWDDYFTSSLADQTRPGASATLSLDENISSLLETGTVSANSRLQLLSSSQNTDKIKQELKAEDGYLKSAKHLIVDGMFNVNSTSVDAWHALFTGIRSRQLVERESGQLKKVNIPSGKVIALSRFNTEVSGKEMDGPEHGVRLSNGTSAWTGVRFLDDAQLRKLAEECVKQVKLRGPFLNYSEFINRRLSNDILGTMGALQSAIDYDDSAPESHSINYKFKNGPDYMITKNHLGDHDFKTPEAAVGSRFTAIPGYIIQSDLLKPIGNTLTVRDDTFRIRAYGEALDATGKVVARAWCEAIVQRQPEYSDTTNDPEVPARTMTTDGKFEENPELTELNRKFGRRFQVESFRWLSKEEI